MPSRFPNPKLITSLRQLSYAWRVLEYTLLSIMDLNTLQK